MTVEALVQRAAGRFERRAAWHDYGARLDRLGLEPGMRVLDAGCGSGLVARMVAERVRPGRVVGLDSQPGMARVAAGLARPRDGAGLAFVAGDIRRLPLPDGTFDAVWSSFALAYVARHPERVVAEFARVTRPGGLVAVVEIDNFMLEHWPIAPDLAARIERWRAWSEAEGVYDQRMGRKLLALFHRAGLTEVQAETCGDPELFPLGRPGDDILSAWRERLEGMGGLAAALGSEQAHARFVRDFMALLERPDRTTVGAVVLVWGRKA